MDVFRSAGGGIRQWGTRLVAVAAVMLGALSVAPAQAPVPAAAPAPVAAPAGRLFVLMINGGGSREENFQSHLAHLRELTTHLLAAKVAKEQITILSSDGPDPEPDVATRNPASEDFWRLEGTPLADLLAEPLRFVDGTVPGMALLPATRASLTQYLSQLRARATSADTLFLYVTDHGSNHPRDPLRNQIVLWGRKAGITVRQLGAELSRLPPGLRVVTMMSQCFSGGFARLRETLTGSARTRLPICGYFASPADRPAYGCFPEADRDNRTGHAFTVIDALAKTGRLRDVHADVLVNDRSPDVPQRTSDVFLKDVISKAAERAGATMENFGDRLLAENRAANKIAEFALADRLSRSYGLSPPLTFAGVDRQIDELTQTRDALDRHQDLWESALAESTRAQLAEFLIDQPAWGPRLRPATLRALPAVARAALTKELLGALRKFAEARRDLGAIAEKLIARVDEAAALAYQIDVREAAFQRVRTLLINAAARSYLVSAYPTHERDDLAAIERCEGLELPSPSPKPRLAPAAGPFPSLEIERKAAAALRPAYLGVAFRPPPAAARRRQSLGDGAALITSVVGGSPAAVAGLGPGDIIIGEPGHPFARENQVRAFTMLSSTAAPVRLEVLRAGAGAAGTRSIVQVKLMPVPAPN